MLRVLVVGAVVSLLLWAAPSASADSITLVIRPSSAPNAFGSPNWGSYVTNALTSLEVNGGNIGDRDLSPAAYEILGPGDLTAGDLMVTSFPSWRGVAAPLAPFAGEYGNRLHFGLHAYGDGTTQFTLEDLSFAVHSSDPADTLQFVGDFVGFHYSSTRFGVHWGADRAKGGGDDTVYTSGNGTTLVDEIVYVGVGNAFWPGGPGDPLTGQAALDATAAYIAGFTPFAVTGTYSIRGFSASATVTTTPEPGTLLTLGAAASAWAGWRRRRRFRSAGTP